MSIARALDDSDWLIAIQGMPAEAIRGVRSVWPEPRRKNCIGSSRPYRSLVQTESRACDH